MSKIIRPIFRKLTAAIAQGLGTASATGFSPASLFAAGEQGAWYDPSDLSTLFSDSAGTTAAVVDGPVGRMLDKSGRGNHATQATTASKPMLRSSGGLYWLEFDGVDDFMSAAAVNFNATDDMSVFAGVRKSSDLAFGVLCELSADINTNNGSFTLRVPNSAGATYGFNSKGTLQAGQGSTSTYAAPHSAVLCGFADIAGDVCGLRVNAASLQTATDQGTGNFGNYPLYLGRRGGTGAPFSGRLHGLIVRGASSAATQVTSTERYLATKTGVSLP